MVEVRQHNGRSASALTRDCYRTYYYEMKEIPFEV